MVDKLPLAPIALVTEGLLVFDRDINLSKIQEILDQHWKVNDNGDQFLNAYPICDDLNENDLLKLAQNGLYGVLYQDNINSSTGTKFILKDGALEVIEYLIDNSEDDFYHSRKF